MADLFPKWIIEDGKIIMGKCVQHWQLSNYKYLPFSEKKEHITGGGWFHHDRDKQIFIFYSVSSDFGGCTLDQVQEAYTNGKGLHKPYGSMFPYGPSMPLPVYFSNHLKLENALKDNVLLTK